MSNHPSVGHVTQGSIADFDSREFPAYPIANIQILSANFGISTTDYTIQLIIADKVKNKNNESDGRTNEEIIPFYGTDDVVDIHANALGIINDLTSYTQYSIDGFDINTDITNEPFEDRFNNGLAGWVSTFTLTAHNDKNRCLFELYPVTTEAPITTTTTTTLTPLPWPTSGNLFRMEVQTNGITNMVGSSQLYAQPYIVSSSAMLGSLATTGSIITDTTASIQSNNVLNVTSFGVNNFSSSNNLGTVMTVFRFAEDVNGGINPMNLGRFMDARDAPDPLNFDRGVSNSFIFPATEEIGTFWGSGSMWVSYDTASLEKFTPTKTYITGSTNLTQKWYSIPGTQNSTDTGSIYREIGMEKYKFLTLSPNSVGIPTNNSPSWSLALWGSDELFGVIPKNQLGDQYIYSVPNTGYDNVNIAAVSVWDRILTDAEIQAAYSYYSSSLGLDI
jgi:hypothetical protein